MILLLCLIINTALANDQGTAWKIGEKRIVFRKANPVYCVPKSSSCLAKKKLKTQRLAAGMASMAHDRNPTAELCPVAGGKLVIGTDANKNENSFCRFADGSLVSATALYKAAAKREH